MMDAAEILRRHELRRAERAPYEAKWQEIAPMLRPLRDEFVDGFDASGRRGGRNYDSAGPVALDEAGSAIYSMLTSTDNVWAPIEFEERALREDSASARWIEHVNTVIFASMDPGVSGFYTEAPETILDCIGFGNGAFYSARPPGANFILDQAVPLAECYAEWDAYGGLSAFDRRYRQARAAILRQFPDAPWSDAFREKASRQPAERIEVLHSSFVQDAGPERLHPLRVASVYLVIEGAVMARVGGYAEMPYFFPSWSRARNESYGRGRGEFALADTQILSEMGRTALTQGQRAAEPPLLTHSEVGAFVSLEPNAVNAGGLDDRGNPLIRPLDIAGSIPLTLEMQEQRRQAIREAFYASMLSLVGSPTPSVVEILKRDERRDQSMGPNLARIMQQFLAPFVLRRFAMLDRAGQFDPPPPQAQRAGLRVRFVSPLAKAHRSQKAVATMNAVAAVAQIAAVDPDARFELNGKAAVRHVIDGLAAPDDVLYSRQEAAARRKAAQEAEQMAFAAQTGQQAAQAVDALARADAASRQ